MGLSAKDREEEYGGGKAISPLPPKKPCTATEVQVSMKKAEKLLQHSINYGNVYEQIIRNHLEGGFVGRTHLMPYEPGRSPLGDTMTNHSLLLLEEEEHEAEAV